MSTAKEFKKKMETFIKETADQLGGDVKTRVGIVAVTFPDGSVVDFTEPKANG